MKNPEYELVVSVVLFNTDLELPGKVIDCLNKNSIKKKIVFIDNSPDNRLETLFTDRDDVEYIFMGKNLGYGSGHNVAIRKYLDKSRYHLVMNADIYFDEYLLDKLFEFMELNQDVGLVMPKIIYPDGQIQYLCKLLPTPFDLIFRRFLPFSKIKEKRNRIYELRDLDYNKIYDVPNLSGCFMFMRSSVLEIIGLFDERFFMYLEDTDLVRRIGEKYRTVFYPHASVVHGYEKGSYKNFRLLIYHIKSAVYYFNKWGWLFDKNRKKNNAGILKEI